MNTVGSIDQYRANDNEVEGHCDGTIASGYSIHGSEIGMWSGKREEVVAEMVRFKVFDVGQVDERRIEEALAKVEAVCWENGDADISDGKQWWLPSIRDYLLSKPRHNDGRREGGGNLYLGISDYVFKTTYITDACASSIVMTANQLQEQHGDPMKG